MEKIGILQSAGIAGRIIELALAEPEMKDLFTPIVYSKDNGNDKNVGQDLRFRNIDALVVAPGSTAALRFDEAMTMYVGEHVKLCTAMPELESAQVYEQLTKEVLMKKVEKVWQSLRRDFTCTMPRIAVIALNATVDDAEKNVMEPALKELEAQGVRAFGPFLFDDFMQNQWHEEFDAVLTITDQQTQQFLEAYAGNIRTRLLIGLPAVLTSTEFPEGYQHEEHLQESALALLRSCYLAVDVCRCRAYHDACHASPLPKLYHERRDDSEKVRFKAPLPFMVKKGEGSKTEASTTQA